MEKKDRVLAKCICGNCKDEFDCEHCSSKVCTCDCADVGIEDLHNYVNDLAYFKTTGQKPPEQISDILWHEQQKTTENYSK